MEIFLNIFSAMFLKGQYYGIDAAAPSVLNDALKAVIASEKLIETVMTADEV